MALSDDTSAAAQEVYYRRLAEMTPAERVNIAVELWTAAYATQAAMIRHSNPEVDESEIRFRIAASRFGEELARKAYVKT